MPTDLVKVLRTSTNNKHKEETKLKLNSSQIKHLLDEAYHVYNNTDFIINDPISVPHCFSQKADIEIAGLFAAIFAWGNRKTIISKSIQLMKLMDNQPHGFVTQHATSDLKRFLHFAHRTFNDTDLLYFISFLKNHYTQYDSLEYAFSLNELKSKNVFEALVNFNHTFFSELDVLPRKKKHISSPLKNSSCKRLCMYLRWMVRQDSRGVDFGLWQNIKPDQLICPLDVHVLRVATRLGLIKAGKANWASAVELTEQLRNFDAADPVKYDFALFGMGVLRKL